MEYYQGKICLSYEDLTSGDDPIVKYDTLKSWLRRKKAVCARPAYGRDVIALIEYDTLPGKAKQKIVERYGDPREILQPKGELAWLAEDLDAKRFYHYEYRYELNGTMVTIPEHIADEYELNARVAKAIIERQANLIQMTNKLNNKRKNIWDLLKQYSEELRHDYGHTLPKSKSRLQKKINEFKKVGYECLISGKLGNSNTQKITADRGEYLIALMRNRDYVHSFETAMQQYNNVAKEKGWEVIQSVATVRDFLSDPAVKPLWLGQANGESKVNTKYGAQFVGLTKPKFANSLWAADGTKLNLFYTNEEGKIATTDIYMVFDVCTGYCVGWALGKENAYNVQYPAFRMAINLAGVKPFQLVMDNQSSQKKLDRVGFFSRMTEVGVRFKTPYRKQANPAEHLIGQFQRAILSHYPYFTGYNITAKGERSEANREWIDANLDHLPTHQGLHSLVEECIQQWNSLTPRGEEHTREQLYKVERVNPDRFELTQEDMVELFWFKRKRTSTFVQGGLTITENKKEYHYDAYTADGKIDFDWRLENTHREFGVKYDPMDETKIAIYRIDKDDAWRFERYLYPALKVAMAAEDRTAKDEELTKHMLDGDKMMRVKRNAIGLAIDEKYKQHTKYNYPRMLGASKRDNEKVVEVAKKLANKEDMEVVIKGARTSLAVIKKEESKMDVYDIAPTNQDIKSKFISKR